MMKIIVIGSLLILTACTQETSLGEDLNKKLNVNQTSISESQVQIVTDQQTETSKEKLKAYFINVHVASIETLETMSTRHQDGNISYFHETKDPNPGLSLLKLWAKNSDLEVNYEKMQAISKSKGLVFHVKKDYQEIPAEEAWIYREAE